jgi:hypothetical protein
MLVSVDGFSLSAGRPPLGRKVIAPAYVVSAARHLGNVRDGGEINGR